MKHTESVIQSDPLVGHDARTVPEMDGACRSHRPPMGRAIPLLLPSGREVDGRYLCGARPGQGSSAVGGGGGHRAGERIALKVSGIFTCARLHAAGTD